MCEGERKRERVCMWVGERKKERKKEESIEFLGFCRGYRIYNADFKAHDEAIDF